jgi:hypothetical protein
MYGSFGILLYCHLQVTCYYIDRHFISDGLVVRLRKPSIGKVT